MEHRKQMQHKKELIENSLRIKVTGRCNRECSFCHQEGGMDNLNEIVYSDELKDVVNELSERFGIDSIALTGGEPLIHNNLLELVQALYTNTKIKRFSITTNGTIAMPDLFWDNLIEYGLYKVNISMPDLLQYSKERDSKGLSFIDQQIKTIKKLNSLEINPSINIVVFSDKYHLKNLLSFLQLQKDITFETHLLPDLTNERSFNRSQATIGKILSDMDCKPERTIHGSGTSRTSIRYRTSTGFPLIVKTTKPSVFLNSLCSNCEKKKDCQEGFYGIRLEQRDTRCMIRLCLYRSSEDVLLLPEDFYKADVYRELKRMWK